MSFGEYEVKHKPLFASMKRARLALRQSQRKPCHYDEFFKYLKQVYGTNSETVEYVTFYDYIDNNDDVHYTIAYIYTARSRMMRDVLFEDREDITKFTGWYPMVSGSRANFTTINLDDSYKFYGIYKNHPPYVHLGKPLSIQNVATDISSTALLLKCDKGNILLDTGFEVRPEVIDDLNFIFLSHFHKDHSAGLFQILKMREVPVILSSISLMYLLNINGITEDEKILLLKNAVLIEKIANNSRITVSFEPFETYHCPGSYGFKYKFYNEVFVYPGDFCLRNSFYNYERDLLERLPNRYCKINMLIDCALINKGNFSTTEDTFSDIVRGILTSNAPQLFISNGVEMLFNIYLYLFRLAVDKHKDWVFFVDDGLYQLLQNVLRTWILPQFQNDPFIDHVIGKTRMNFAETRRLFAISDIEQFEDFDKSSMILIISSHTFSQYKDILRGFPSDVYLTGPIATSRMSDNLLDGCECKSIYRLSSPDWSFHSDKVNISELLTLLIDRNITPYLFHEFPKKLVKYCKEFTPQIQDSIKIISQKELSL